MYFFAKFEVRFSSIIDVFLALCCSHSNCRSTRPSNFEWSVCYKTRTCISVAILLTRSFSWYYLIWIRIFWAIMHENFGNLGQHYASIFYWSILFYHILLNWFIHPTTHLWSHSSFKPSSAFFFLSVLLFFFCPFTEIIEGCARVFLFITHTCKLVGY